MVAVWMSKNFQQFSTLGELVQSAAGERSMLGRGITTSTRVLRAF